MGDENQEHLSAALCDVLERQAFAFAEPAPLDDLGIPGEPPLCATMTFSGPSRGELGLVVPPEVATEIAASLLGVDADDDEARAGAEDALKEVLNVACGQYLTSAFGVGPVFHLSIPQVVELEPEQWELIANRDGAIGLLLDDRPLLAYVALEGSVP